MLIYKLLGDSAQQEFARTLCVIMWCLAFAYYARTIFLPSTGSWGISYGAFHMLS